MVPSRSSHCIGRLLSPSYACRVLLRCLPEWPARLDMPASGSRLGPPTDWATSCSPAARKCSPYAPSSGPHRTIVAHVECEGRNISLDNIATLAKAMKDRLAGVLGPREVYVSFTCGRTGELGCIPSQASMPQLLADAGAPEASLLVSAAEQLPLHTGPPRARLQSVRKRLS